MKRFAKLIPLLLMLLVLTLPLCAQAVTTVPGHVTQVDNEAFAGAGIDALIVPGTVERLGANVLQGSNAHYIYLQSASTQVDVGAGNGVAYVFGPAGSSASALSNFYPTENLVEEGGLYYYVAGGQALPLCAKAARGISGTVTVPKLVNGVPVTSLQHLYLLGTQVTAVQVPAYLGQVNGMSTGQYQTMSLTEPVPGAAEITLGSALTWSTSVTGSYGEVTYQWIISVGGTTGRLTTYEPTVLYTPTASGECTVTVTATDELGDTATASGGKVTVKEPAADPAAPVYRALLIGNTYPDTDSYLPGCDNDVAAMALMLDSMNGTNYHVTTAENLSSEGMKAAIASTFGSAKSNDVSLFFFSGHGGTDGSLIGTGDAEGLSEVTFLNVFGLRRALEKIPGTKVVLLDCCHSGTVINKSLGGSPSDFNSAIISAFAASAQTKGVDDLADEGFIVLTACRSEEVSQSLGDHTGHWWGVFTYGVCYGSGYDHQNRESLNRLPADVDGNGAITLGEAYNGVLERVAYLDEEFGFGVTQSTQYYGDTAFVLWRNTDFQ